MTHRDQTTASLGQTTTSPSLTMTSSGQTMASRGQTMASSGQTMTSRDQTTASLGQTMTSLGQTTTSRSETMTSSGRAKAARSNETPSAFRAFGVNGGGGDTVGRGRDDDVHAGGEAAELRRLAVDGDLGRGRDFVFLGLMIHVDRNRDRHQMNGGDPVIGIDWNRR